MTREEDIKALTAKTKQVCELALDGTDHLVALEALLSAFATIASTHSCCTATAARLAGAVAINLQQLAGASVLPPSQRMH